MSFRKPFFAAVLLLLAALTAGRAAAGTTGEFNAAVADAYDNYRQAVFYLRTGNAGVAGIELTVMADKWTAIREEYAAAPPDGYQGDDRFRASLDAVAADLEKAIDAVGEGKTEDAAEALGPIRDVLSDLRHRNNIETFSDCVDEINASMERLWPFRHDPPDFDKPEEVDKLRYEVAVSLYLYKKCYAEAPAAYRDDPEFKRLFENGIDSFTRIWEPIRQKNARGVINFLRELRSLDKMVFLRFG